MLTAIVVALFAISSGTSSDRSRSVSVSISEALLDDLNLGNPFNKRLVWVYFTDKPSGSSEPSLTERALLRQERRSLVQINDEINTPVSSAYIRTVSETGAEIRNRSRWFNAVSCYADAGEINMISQFPFVSRIEHVGKYKSEQAEYSDALGHSFQFDTDDPTGLNYGASLNQSNIINIPPAHDLGFTGSGVLIASFDAGFDNLEHFCFNRIRQKGLRTYDFVNGDTIVANDTGRMGNGAHGTLTLSLIAGYDPGSLVSPAFDAQYILAKTENTESETPLEEDNWIAAAEWADSLGADIITSSLGYLQFNDPYPSYNWQSMNGTTALITRAADIAVSKGIIVVTSAGNGSFNSTHNTLSAPADAFNVITVGAVTSGRQRASFSSVGPTVDGRIKPEVMALGVNNYTARPGAGGAGYLNSNVGTSLACPMVAGVCAMILSANPDINPLQMKDFLANTASNSTSPNNTMGYGIVNAYSALRLALISGPNNPNDFILGQNFPNPFNPSTTFRFALTRAANVELNIYDLRGRLIDKIVDSKVFPAGVHDIESNFSGYDLASGVYFYSLIVNNNLIDTKKMMLTK